MPPRGDRFHHCLLMPVLALLGNPASPAYNKPDGALRKTLLFTPFRKLSMLKTEITPLGPFGPKCGPRRPPQLPVPRLDPRHESCPYRPVYTLSTGSLPRPPCSTLVRRPVRKSASPRLVVEPSKIQLPL